MPIARLTLDEGDNDLSWFYSCFAVTLSMIDTNIDILV